MTNLSADIKQEMQNHFSKLLKGDIKRIQVVANLRRRKEYPDGLQLVRAGAWLQKLDF